MTLLAVPSPSPINVTVNVSPDTALDHYTMVLADATIALAAFTVLLAIIGGIALLLQNREIKAAERQLELAQAESQATQEQLRLACEQFEAARRAARPERLRPVTQRHSSLRDVHHRLRAGP